MCLTTMMTWGYRSLPVIVFLLIHVLSLSTSRTSSVRLSEQGALFAKSSSSVFYWAIIMQRTSEPSQYQMGIWSVLPGFLKKLEGSFWEKRALLCHGRLFIALVWFTTWFLVSGVIKRRGGFHRSRPSWRHDCMILMTCMTFVYV